MEQFTTLSLLHYTASLLKDTFPSEEIQALQKLVFEKKLGLPLHKIYLNPNDPIDSENAKIIVDIVSKLKLQKPIQYILGETDFFGLNFKVNPNVLIPRPETEELVDWVIKSSTLKQPSILDVGTGSGCIAISLAANIKAASVTAIDISNEALEVAKGNATINNTIIDFFMVDFLDSSIKIPNAPFDIIVSNPPYVRDLEKELMKVNVLDHEPHLALFVNNSHPLIFYKAIAERAGELLRLNGRVYCEINEALGFETAELFKDFGFSEVEIRKDLNGKDRMIRAIWK